MSSAFPPQDRPLRESRLHIRRPAAGASRASERELVTTLFDLGRQVTSVLDLDELLPQIPRLIGRLIPFDAFAVYLLDERRGELRMAYAVGYPEPNGPIKLRSGAGLVGAAVSSEQPLLVNDVAADPRYVEVVPGMESELVVPLRAQVAADRRAEHPQPQPRPVHAARRGDRLRSSRRTSRSALVNARLFERSRARRRGVRDARRNRPRRRVGARSRRAASRASRSSTRRVIDYRTFGILLAQRRHAELEMKLAVQYGEKVDVPRVPLGEGLVGYAALHREPVLVPDVSQDPRYINVVADVRSELAIPMLLKDRCIGVVRSREPRARRVHASATSRS